MNSSTIEVLINRYRIKNRRSVSREQFYEDIMRARRADFFDNPCMYALFGSWLLLLFLLPRGSIYDPAFYWPMGAAIAICMILSYVFRPKYLDSQTNMYRIYEHIRVANKCLGHNPAWKQHTANLVNSGPETRTPLDVYVAEMTTSGDEQACIRAAYDALWFEADSILKRETGSVSRRAKKRIKRSTEAFIAFGLLPDDTDSEQILANVDHVRNFG